MLQAARDVDNGDHCLGGTAAPVAFARRMATRRRRRRRRKAATAERGGEGETPTTSRPRSQPRTPAEPTQEALEAKLRKKRIRRIMDTLVLDQRMERARRWRYIDEGHEKHPLLPKGWYRPLIENSRPGHAELHTAWYLLSLVVEAEIFHESFLVMPFLSAAAAYAPWQVLVKRRRLLGIGNPIAPDQLRPIGPLVALLDSVSARFPFTYAHDRPSFTLTKSEFHLRVRHRGRILAGLVVDRVKRGSKNLPASAIPTLVEAGGNGRDPWVEVGIDFEGLHSRGTCPLSPGDEARLDLKKLAKLSQGRCPSKIYVVQEAAYADKMQIHLKVGDYCVQRTAYNQLIGFRLTSYRWDGKGLLRFPHNWYDGDEFPHLIDEPAKVHRFPPLPSLPPRPSQQRQCQNQRRFRRRQRDELDDDRVRYRLHGQGSDVDSTLSTIPSLMDEDVFTPPRTQASHLKKPPRSRRSDPIFSSPDAADPSPSAALEAPTNFASFASLSSIHSSLSSLQSAASGQLAYPRSSASNQPLTSTPKAELKTSARPMSSPTP